MKSNYLATLNFLYQNADLIPWQFDLELSINQTICNYCNDCDIKNIEEYEVSKKFAKLLLLNPHLNILWDKYKSFIFEHKEKSFLKLLETILKKEKIDFKNFQLSSRQVKNKFSLVLILAQFCGDIPAVIISVLYSKLADRLIMAAMVQSINTYCTGDEKDLYKDNITIYSMGKLGGFDLNYSSDVDLIMFYDNEKITTFDEKLKLRKVCKEFIKLIQEFTDGFIFRLDFRLRPDPGVTDIFVSISKAINYYKNIGEDWERAALIKLRYCAGSEKLANYFQKEINKFIWEIDNENKIEEFRKIQIKIQKHLNPQNIKNNNEINVKYIRGGIRDIELFCQINQLLFGRRDIIFRKRNTLMQLYYFEQNKIISKQDYILLFQTYCFLRHIENFLQMNENKQKHFIAKSDKFLFTSNIDYENIENLENYINILTNKVKTITYGFFNSNDDVLDYQHNDENIKSISNQAKKNSYHNFLSFLSKDAKNYMDLEDQRLKSNLSNIFTKSEYIFTTLCKFPTIFLNIDVNYYFNEFRIYEVERKIKNSIANYNMYKDENAFANIFIDIGKIIFEAKLQLRILFLLQKVNIYEVEKYLSYLADLYIISIARLIKLSDKKYENIQICIIALGKLGNQSLTFNSDLDLIFVFKLEKQNEKERKKLQSFFIELLTKLHTSVFDQNVYLIDLDLRPNGSRGTNSIELENLRNYVENNAEYWELLTSIKARFIGGNEEIFAEVQEFYNNKHATYNYDDKKLIELLERVDKTRVHINLFQFKHYKYGITDIELFLQHLYLKKNSKNISYNLHNDELFTYIKKNYPTHKKDIITLENNYKILYKLLYYDRILEHYEMNNVLYNEFLAHINIKEVSEDKIKKIAKQELKKIYNQNEEIISKIIQI